MRLALLVASLGPLRALSVSISQSEGSVANTLPNEGPAWESDEAESLLPLLCTQPSSSLAPPSSAHSLRASDIALVSAIGLPHSHRIEPYKVLSRLFEVLSMFNPTLTNMLPDPTSMRSSQYRSLSAQAEGLVHSLQGTDLNKEWKLLLLFVPVDKLCLCPEQASTALTDTVQQVEETLNKLQSQLTHTLISAVVWVGQSDDVRDAQHDRICNCEQTYSTAGLRLTRTVLAHSLQESLERQLQARRWYSDREDFTVVLQASPMVIDMQKSRASIDRVVVDLWRNLLQPMKWQPGVKGNDIMSTPCPSEAQPFLRTQRNSPSKPLIRRDRSITFSPILDPIMGTELPCEDLSASSSPPTTVHALRPGDIKVVAAIGDSITAANGVGANPNNLLDVIKEYRGLSWSIGGDANLTTVTTLPNILRQFNPSLTGFSEGIGDENFAKAFLNQAVPGAKSEDMPSQVRRLVDKMKNDKSVDFQNDWKVITMFIGGNDLCDFCTDSIYYSADNIISRIREALDILHTEVPRAIVNLVELMHLVPLRRLHQDSTLNCPTGLVKSVCRCVVAPKEGSIEHRNLINLNRAYQRRTRELVESGRYDRHSNFTVVLQPFFREVVLPLLEDGRPDRSYFAPDCFHLSQKSHTLMARALWNNMLEPLGNKTHKQDFTSGLSLKCPSKVIFPGDVMACGKLGEVISPARTWHNPILYQTQFTDCGPADIKVVAAMGDSLTAGFGAKSKSLFDLKTEYRGVAWSIGGDETLKEVTTLPNILRRFNPSLHGFSKGEGIEQTGFNLAVSGAKAFDIPDQARKLIEALKKSKDVDFAKDWKLVTLFVGGNDLCQYCLDRASLSPQNYSYHLRESLDLLYQVPRMLVNVVEILQIIGLRRISANNFGCSLVQKNVCPCALVPLEDSLELSELKRINRLYQEESQNLVSGGRYDGREDFAVVTQPYFRNTVVPVNSDQKPDVSYFSVDCFHFSERGHAEMAIALWNNMLEPVGRKEDYNNFTTDRHKIQCPTQDKPYIFTRVNSFPSIPTTTTLAPSTPTTTSTPSTTTGPPPQDPNSVHAWVAALLAVIGLLIGCGVTWLILACKGRKQQTVKENATEMKGTVF
ncbi:hypothetical protein SKAU_G00332640 [Synaphobranchus kaupii]|uniref:Triacylglycerol lipase n=1 Tax=Synaphobranchus kaupii TaxID=118154 RepID=A0A9Q1ELG2_SYNKA|nr:hypothetical protein SKAU_G00332640 [Synaphobranchus kaupii]